MSLLANVVGFGAFGFGVRCFQLGLQKQNMFTRMLYLRALGNTWRAGGDEPGQ